MSTLCLVFNDRSPHFFGSTRPGEDGLRDYGRDLVIAILQTDNSDGTFKWFSFKPLTLPGPTGSNPSQPSVSYSAMTPAALYVDDGLHDARLYIASQGGLAQPLMLYTVSPGFLLEDNEWIQGASTGAPVQLSWIGGKPNVAFRHDMAYSVSVAQRMGPNPKHPNWGNWEILTQRTNDPGVQGGSVNQPSILCLGDRILCFKSVPSSVAGGPNNGQPTDECRCHVSFVSSGDYMASQNDDKIRWKNYELNNVALRYAPAPLTSYDGSNLVFVFYVGTNGSLWMNYFSVDDDGLPKNVSGDSTIETKAFEVPGTKGRINTTPTPVIYNRTMYVFFRDYNYQLQYMIGDTNGMNWRVGSDLGILLPREETAQIPPSANYRFPYRALGGVSAIVVDNAFLARNL